MTPVAALLALGLFAFYSAGASRTIFVGDSGELVAAAHTLGIPHPSGYPLYVLLGKIWTLLLPLGSVAFRMSLMSAFFGALACALLYGLLRWLGCGRTAAVLGALLLGVSPSFWSQANIQRVYTLNAVFVVAATWAMLCWLRERSDRTLAWTLFLCLLGACNHLFMGVYGLWIAVFALAVERQRLLRPRTILRVGGTAVLGLLPYLYLPLRSWSNPRLDWGNPETFQGVLGVIFRKGYWHRPWLEYPSDLLIIFGDYLGSFATELSWVGVALAAVGIG